MAKINWVKVRCTITIPAMKIKAIKFVRAIVNQWLFDNVEGYHNDTPIINGVHTPHPLRFGLKKAKYFIEGAETEIPFGAITFLENGMPTHKHMSPDYHRNSLIFDYAKNPIEVLLHREHALQKEMLEIKKELEEIHAKLGFVPKWN